MPARIAGDRVSPVNKKFEGNLAIRLAFTDADELEYKPHTTRLIVEKLQPWSLRRSTADVKGGAFEDFLSKTFRDDLGQYFTPTPVINLVPIRITAILWV